GCPPLMLYYAFYNAPLMLVMDPGNPTEMASSFVDNVMFLAIAITLYKAHEKIADMKVWQHSGLSWSQEHNSPFELSKLALINFS
ncbi:hypothetical protein C0989_005406, partial [Termitomyces sp. Mn162]